ncbi:hypothetical protein [Roseisalinus antarcticus]|uniref:MetA-pathway of phenol degradation n=1 Tax=Roseisalinus antarcticus TaxID=254357 RepID=A0A1Y5T0U8_9RHOB|nr:hypothetical protein [Roseisalinus antarcticus]SLN51487.1 hypothetical protein ROA7023_02260 [Roseisalinus antarcticus]
MRHLALLLALTILASPAAAGAWMRGKGEMFLSFGANIALSDAATRPVHWDPTVYLEYGLAERATVGLDLYIANGDDEETGSVFLRFPVGPTDARTPVAVTLTYGLRHERDPELFEQVARLGLSVGRGLADGWLAADATAIFVIDSDQTEGKLDLTWGHDFNDRWTAVMQMQTGIGTAGDFYAKAAPSALFRVNDRTRVEVGVVQALTGDLGTGFRIATWWEF